MILRKKTAAWTRKEGKNPEGGLNDKGRESYEKDNPGSDLKPPVKSGDNPRRGSFLVRMGNMKGPEKDSKGRPTRLLKSLKAWGASSKAAARRIGKNILIRFKSRQIRNILKGIFSAGYWANKVKWSPSKTKSPSMKWKKGI